MCYPSNNPISQPAFGLAGYKAKRHFHIETVPMPYHLVS